MIRGGQGGLLKAEQADQYVRRLPRGRLLVFPDSGHELWQPDHARFTAAVRGFLAELDGAP